MYKENLAYHRFTVSTETLNMSMSNARLVNKKDPVALYASSRRQTNHRFVFVTPSSQQPSAVYGVQETDCPISDVGGIRITK